MLQSEYMKIRFTPEALSQLKSIVKIRYQGTGFLLGAVIGRFTLIETLFPLTFNRRTIQHIYPVVYSNTKKPIVGVFFSNQDVFLNDWFLESLVMTIEGDETDINSYRIHSNGVRKCFRPLVKSLEVEVGI